MKKLKRVGALVLLVAAGVLTPTSAQTARWTEQRANVWYARQPWLVGSNFIPKSAINQLEMWQEATFDLAEIEKELRTLFVLFDSCWDPLPHLGPQHPPTPGVHNSGWVQSPGAAALGDASQYPRLKAYVLGVIGAFAKDDRVLAWDLWNEPGADNLGSYPNEELKDKVARV